MISLWQDTEHFNDHPVLEGTVKADVLIVGGGMAGVLCGYLLEERGVNCIVVEQNRIGQGITGKTTGKVTSQHGFLYHKLLKQVGKEDAERYLKANDEAVKEYERIAAHFQCDFEKKTNIVFSTNGSYIAEQEAKSLEQLRREFRYFDKGELKSELPIAIDGAIGFLEQAQFHPLKFLKGISSKLEIYENTKVLNIEGTEAMVAGGRIKADRIVVATHFPFLTYPGAYFLKMHQERAYVIAGTGGDDLENMYVDQSGKGLSLRNHGEYLILGGGSNRAGKIDMGWKELEQKARRFYPNWETEYQWANQDCMSLDHMPYIGSYYGEQDKILVATGFNKWGMTGAMVAAKLLADTIAGTYSPYIDLFDPGRPMVKETLLSNAIQSAGHLLAPKVPRCRHLGCALLWNERESTWDCPCHGSRYDAEGRCIENPASHGFYQS